MMHHFFSLGRNGPRGGGGVLNLLGSGPCGDKSAQGQGQPQDANSIATLAPPCIILWAYVGEKRLSNEIEWFLARGVGGHRREGWTVRPP